MLSYAPWIIACVAGYLMGSIPFGLVLTRVSGIDLRTIGSGNIGATNVLRTGRRDLAFATLILDSFKAGFAVLAISAVFGRNAGLVAGAAAFVGHCYPVWLQFKGGKGVATYAGLLAFASPLGLAVAAPIWLATFAISRISSFSALIAAIAAPIGAHFLGDTPFAAITLGALSVLVFWTHRENIARLLRGEEPRFGTKKA